MFVLEAQDLVAKPDGEWTTLTKHELYAVVADAETKVLAVRDAIFGTPEDPTSDEPVPPVRIRNDEVYATPQALDEAEAEADWDDYPEDE